MKSLFDNLKLEFQKTNADLKTVASLLKSLKLELVSNKSFLQPCSQQDLLMTREILEIGAYYSIRVKDIPAFERYLAQLKVYYQDYSSLLPVSPRMYCLLGLGLLGLLAQNKIAEFHTELERLDQTALSNVYIKHPISIEQCLMEGSFNKIWNARVNVPAEEYAFFMDILMGTIRNEIADCSEKAYTYLPIADAASILYFKNPKEANDFFKQRGWKIVNEQIHFTKESLNSMEIPVQKMVTTCLDYAKELERIV